MLNLNNLKSADKKKKKRVGRGDASGHGTYSGRGLKGQRSRSGGKGGLKYKGLKQSLTKLPKLRGFKSLKPDLPIINIEDLEKKYKAGETVDLCGYKVLAQGEIKKKLTVKASAFSKVAENAITKAGGKIILCGKN